MIHGERGINLPECCHAYLKCRCTDVVGSRSRKGLKAPYWASKERQRRLSCQQLCLRAAEAGGEAAVQRLPSWKGWFVVCRLRRQLCWVGLDGAGCMLQVRAFEQNRKNRKTKQRTKQLTNTMSVCCQCLCSHAHEQIKWNFMQHIFFEQLQGLKWEVLLCVSGQKLWWGSDGEHVAVCDMYLDYKVCLCVRLWTVFYDGAYRVCVW